MRDWLWEVLVVLCHSVRTQLAIAFGLIFFAGTLLTGHVLADRLELRGPVSPLADVIRDVLTHRYDKAAWMALGAFLLAAIKTFRKDRRRLVGL
jgi:hypothetical protein